MLIFSHVFVIQRFSCLAFCFCFFSVASMYFSICAGLSRAWEKAFLDKLGSVRSALSINCSSAIISNKLFASSCTSQRPNVLRGSYRAVVIAYSYHGTQCLCAVTFVLCCLALLIFSLIVVMLPAQQLVTTVCLFPSFLDSPRVQTPLASFFTLPFPAAAFPIARLRVHTLELRAHKNHSRKSRYKCSALFSTLPFILHLPTSCLCHLFYLPLLM